MSKTRHYGGTESWVILARLADMALRRRVAVDLKLENPRMRSDAEFRTGDRRFSVTFAIANEAATLEAFRPLDKYEAEGLAERMFSMWSERANRARLELEAPEPPPDVVLVRDATECPTCGAIATMPCGPVHDGERDAGDWVHPARRRVSDAEMRPHPNALKIAADVVRREGRGITLGPDHSTSQSVLTLALAVIAYARHDARSQARGAPTAAEIDERLNLNGVPSHPNPWTRAWMFEEFENYPETDARDTTDVSLLPRAQIDQARGDDLDRWGPGTSKRCTCHTTANQHTRECALAGQPPTETSK